jgi:integrase/recombinase XerD
VAELCGLHLEDLHLVPSAIRLGCSVAGPHLHVLRREDNENRALAKSVFPGVVPVTKALVLLHDAYRAERDTLSAAASSDYLLVNLWREPFGALTPDSIEQLFVRLSAKALLAHERARRQPPGFIAHRPGEVEREAPGIGSSGPDRAPLAVA